MQNGDIPKTYTVLIKYVSTLKAHCSKQLSVFTFGNTFQGYMDYTYFYFFDSFLRSQYLRFGIVLNHIEMRFELWLLGQNAEIQKKYWKLLKDSEWNKHQTSMPKYSVLEIVLVENPDFNNLDVLTQNIEKEVLRLSEDVINFLKQNKF